MTDFLPLTPEFSVAPQIDVADVERARALGFRSIVNNRPEGEAPDQPEGDAIRAAAEAAGLSYHAIPVRPGGFTMEQVEALRHLLSAGPVLAFCRSGTRSTLLWALACAASGADIDELASQAAAKGYDLSPVLATCAELKAMNTGGAS